MGDRADVKVTPENGYGERFEEAIQQVDKAQLAHLPGLEVGMPLQADSPDGPVNFVITEIGEDIITLDGNHPLAGMELNFAVEVVKVEETKVPEEKHALLWIANS